MTEYYKNGEWYYKVLRKTKTGVRVLEVGNESFDFLNIPVEWLGKTCTKAQFEKAGKRVTEKILKAIGD